MNSSTSSEADGKETGSNKEGGKEDSVSSPPDEVKGPSTETPSADSKEGDLVNEEIMKKIEKLSGHMFTVM